MSLKKRLIAVFCILAMTGAAAFLAVPAQQPLEPAPQNILKTKPTITLWYTDEAMGDYLSSVALDYLESCDIRVLPVLVSGLDYLEAIHDASMGNTDGSGGNAPDLYLISNDSLEKAYLAGLAQEIQTDGIVSDGGALTSERFPEAALNAVTYQGKRVAFPLYYETSALVYNETYLQQAAREMGVAEDTLIPRTIEDILSFADAYNAPETVEAVFKWDVSDIFYNYFFAGHYISVGGPCGDDESRIDIYNREAVTGLKAYQDLNQFFSIDAETSSYEAVAQDFLDGKLVFTVATTDMLGRVEKARAEGTFPYEYDVAALPDISAQTRSGGLSVTYALAINGYSTQKGMASDFALFLLDQDVSKMYARTGRLSAQNKALPDVPGAEGFSAEYAKSVPMPKLMSTENFWVWMEVAYTRIWQGENVSDILKALSEQIMTQVTGSPYEETEYIEVPEASTQQDAAE